MHATKLLLALCLSLSLPACDDWPIEGAAATPFGPCLGADSPDPEDPVICALGTQCLDLEVGTMCSPPCDEAGPAGCRDQAPESLVPLGEEFTCLVGQCAVLCGVNDWCPSGMTCTGDICLWP
jgi:hypothetical protein